MSQVVGPEGPAPGRVVRRSELWHAVLAGGLGAAAFAGLELIAARFGGHPLDPEPSGLVAWATALGLAAVAAGGAWALRRRSPMSGASLGLAAASWVWAPETLRAAGVASPDLPGIALASLLAGVAWRWPRLGLLVGALGALGRPAASALRGPVAGLAADRGAPRWIAGGADGGESSPRDPAAAGPRPDILLVTVDTVRADAGLVAGLPGDWQVYDTAISAAPWTLPAMLSIMTGLPVRDHGGGLALDTAGAGTGFSTVLPDVPWLPAALAAEGYATAAVVCNPHLRANLGFARGFRRFLHHDDARDPQVFRHAVDAWHRRRTGASGTLGATRDARIEATAREFITAPADSPRFLWVHLLDPHEYRRFAAAPPAGWRPGTDDAGLLRRTYAGNVAASAARVARLAEAADGWLVVVTSDHGEALGEKGRWGHGRTLDDLELRVPLAIRWPGGGASRIAEQVAAFEVAGLLRAPHRGRLDAAEFVEVGGVRRDPSRFARRRADGRVLPAEAGRVGAATAISEEQRQALERLGYLDEPTPDATGTTAQPAVPTR